MRGVIIDGMRYEAQFFCSRVYLGAKISLLESVRIRSLTNHLSCGASHDWGNTTRYPTRRGLLAEQKEEVMHDTYFLKFRSQEFSIDGFIGCAENTVGGCESCGEENTPRGVNDVAITEVRDGKTQVLLDLNSPIVVGLKKELDAILKVGKHLCFNCLPEVSKQMAL